MKSGDKKIIIIIKKEMIRLVLFVKNVIGVKFMLIGLKLVKFGGKLNVGIVVGK